MTDIIILLEKSVVESELCTISNISNSFQIVCLNGHLSFKTNSKQGNHTVSFSDNVNSNSNNNIKFQSTFYVKHFLPILRQSNLTDKVMLEFKSNRSVIMTMYKDTLNNSKESNVDPVVVKIYPIDEDERVCSNLGVYTSKL